MPGYYPINLSLHNRKCIVVGGGRVAERKVTTLLEYDAVVSLISPEVTPVLDQLAKEGRIQHLARKYEKGDIHVLLQSPPFVQSRLRAFPVHLLRSRGMIPYPAIIPMGRGVQSIQGLITLPRGNQPY